MNNNIFRALSERSFLFLWLGELFTQIAANGFNFFLILYVFDKTQSNIAVSLIVISFTLPSVFFGSFAGAYVDRWDKKNVLFVTNIARAFLLVFLAFFLDNLLLVFLSSLVFSFFTQFFIPAETPMIPLVVAREKLYSANALFGMAIYASLLLAYVLAGPMLVFFKPFGTTVLLAGMFLVGSVFILLIKETYSKLAMTKEVVEEARIWRDLKRALKLVSSTKAVSSSLFLLALSHVLTLMVATIAPGYASSVLKVKIVDFPLLFVTPAAFGMIIGAIVLIRYFHAYPKERLITAGILLSGIAMLLLPFISRLALYPFNQLHVIGVLAFVLGFSNALVFVPANTILQEESSEEFRGKIYGFLNTMVGVLSFVPVLIVGGLSDLIGTRNVIFGIAMVLLALGVSRRCTSSFLRSSRL